MLALKDVPADVRFVCVAVDRWGPLNVVKCGQYVEECQFYMREGRTIMQRSPLGRDGWVEVPKHLRNNGRTCRV